MTHRLQRLFVSLIAALPVLAAADEGMWTVDNFPATAVKQKHGVEITPQWLEKVRLSTVRLSGCTASFVSPDGMILTNHHCVQSCLAQLSTKERDLHKNGYLANGREQELRCPTQNGHPDGHRGHHGEGRRRDRRQGRQDRG